jgi:lactoylglutathione lyase
MIIGLFETHIEVSNLEKAMQFYEGVLGLQLGLKDTARRIAFYWITNAGKAMLGLWEKAQVHQQHFAFQCEADWILNESVNFLRSKQLQPYNFLKDGKEQPMVFTWMPAAAIYFNDPDGNILEFISMLPGEPKPHLGVITYEEWKNISVLRQ